MASSVVAPSDVESTSENDWVYHCKKHSQTAANEFAKAWRQYLHNGANTIEIDSKEVVSKVTEFFPAFLEEALKIVENGEKVQNGIPTPINMPATSTASTSAQPSISVENNIEPPTDESPESPSMKELHKPFFRRLSFKGLRKGKGLFLKQHSDEVELSPHHERHSGRGERNKARTLKLSVECVREGNVQLLAGDTNEGQLNWLKCRMVLAKVGAGCIIEFYSPPKVRKRIISLR